MSLAQKNKGLAHPFINFMAQKIADEEHHWKERNGTLSFSYFITERGRK